MNTEGERVTIDEIEAVLDELRARLVTADQWSKSGATAQAISQAIEIIESLLGDTARMQTLLIGIHQAIAALYEAPAGDVAP